MRKRSDILEQFAHLNFLKPNDKTFQTYFVTGKITPKIDFLDKEMKELPPNTNETNSISNYFSSKYTIHANPYCVFALYFQHRRKLTKFILS